MYTIKINNRKNHWNFDWWIDKERITIKLQFVSPSFPKVYSEMWKISSHTPGLHADSWIFLLSSRWNVNVMPLCWKVDTRNILQHYVTIMLYAAATLLQQCINCSITPHDTAVVNRDGAMPLPMVASFTISTAEEPAPVYILSPFLYGPKLTME